MATIQKRPGRNGKSLRSRRVGIYAADEVLDRAPDAPTRYTMIGIVDQCETAWPDALMVMGYCHYTSGPFLRISQAIPRDRSVDRHLLIDAEAGSIAGITVGMAENELRATGWPYMVSVENMEGDDYRIYNIRLDDEINLKSILGSGNTLYRVLISSPKVKDRFGLGVGSQLSELKRSYPDGKFIYGDADGFYANFITGQKLNFYFDPNDLSAACFDYRQDCKVDDAIKAETVAIN